MRALICGIGGQDGAYLARFLLSKGYEVFGSSRDAMTSSFSNLRRLGILDDVETVSLSVIDFRSVLDNLRRIHPDEVYNLAGQSSVSLSFEQPAETMESIATGALNLLEGIRFLDHPVRYYNAGSSECFGNTGTEPATEDTAFHPQSPYAVAKASAHYLVANYREAYKLFTCSGFLFNHESPLRPERFVTQKIVQTAARIAAGAKDRLQLGNMNIERDWGWAPEYVEAMWLMLQQEKAEDFVIATGHTVPLVYFVESAFSHFGLDWREHTDLDSSLYRPSDIVMGRASPQKAKRILGWSAKTKVDGVIERMCNAAIV